MWNDREKEHLQEGGEGPNGKENIKRLAKLDIETLSSRREYLCLSFAQKCLKNERTKHMFPKNEKNHDMNTRHVEKYQVEYANTERKRNSPIIYMQKLLNANV